MGIFIDFITSEAEKKKTTPAKRLLDLAGMTQKCVFVTHIGKFTDPKISVANEFYNAKSKDNMYLHTGTLNYDMPDSIMQGGAAFMPIAKLLYLPMEDGRSFYHHLKDGDEGLRDDISSLDLNYEEIREQLLNVGFPDGDASDYRMRQIYFPVDGADHLLTVVPSAVLLNETWKRLNDMGLARRLSRNKKEAEYGTPYTEIYNQTQVKHGGTKPQNVSILNNERHGTALLLPSVPPNPVALPKPPSRNIFNNFHISNTLAKHLNKLLSAQVNNIDIRNAVKRDIDYIIDNFIMSQIVYRDFPDGWSDYEKCNLPAYQKIWLDNKYESLRQGDEEWKQTLADEFAKAIIRSFEKINGKEAVLLDDVMFSFIKDRIVDAL